jgi:translation elongation factor EF-G
MKIHEGNSTNKAPLFNGTNFGLWKVRMRTYIMDLGEDVWDVLNTGYVNPIVLANKFDKIEFNFNAKDMNAILSAPVEAKFVKFMNLESAKEMWDKRISNYEGNEKLKDAKLQTYRLQFEQLNMNENEMVYKKNLRVEELTNAMKGLGENIEDLFLVQNILISLPNRFNPKVSAIEELNDLKNFSIDQILGTITDYEMRISKDKPTSR